MNPTIVPKQTLYKTAFSPKYNTYVSLVRASQDGMDRWMFLAEFKDEDDQRRLILFREEELENFVL